MKTFTDDIDKHVGSVLLSQRLDKGFTLNQMADFVGVSYQQIQKYERGTNRVPIDKLQRMAVALQISLQDFFTAPMAQTGELPAQPGHLAVPADMDIFEANEFLTLMARIKNPALRRSLLQLLREMVH